MRTSKAAFAFFIAFATYLACGCTAEEPNPLMGTNAQTVVPSSATSRVGETGRFSDIQTAREEYNSAAEDLDAQLPAGDSFPADMPGAWEENASFEEGFGEMQAALYLQCAWLKSYSASLDNGDVAASATALDRLAAWTSVPEAAMSLDDTYIETWQRDVIQTAQSGDPSFAIELAATC